MSVYQNINGTLARMDASDLAQLAAVDTEGILGGTPGATTNGQTLVDQLAADDVQAKTDIGQIKTDLSDYHVTPSPNLCPYPYGNERGFILSDGSIQYDDSGYISDFISLTSSQYVFSASIHGAAAFRVCWYNNSKAFISRENTNVSPTTFTVPQNAEYVRLCYEDTVSENKYLTNTMFCTKEYWDAHPSYVPYYSAMRDGMFPRSEQAVLGAKNRLPFPYAASSGTFDGASFNVASDGSITVTATQTTANAQFLLTEYITDNRYAGMILSSGQAYDDDCYMRLREALSDNTYVREWSVDGELIIPTMESGHKYFIAIRCGTIGVAINKVFKPMLRLASDPNTTFAPFSLTNTELTNGACRFVRTLTSSDDLNNVKDFGVYSIRSAPTHSPEGKSYGTLEVLPMSNDMDLTDARTQIVLHNDAIYLRVYSGNPLAWSNWVKYTGTVIS